MHRPTALNYNENTTVEDNTTCYYTLPNIVINEIHYNPCTSQGGDFDFEFVELLNAGDLPEDISGYEFYNEAGGVDQLSVLFAEGTTIGAGEFILMVVSEEGEMNYMSTGAQIYVMEAGNFSNSGEGISLRDAFGNTVDAVSYDDSGAWPSGESFFNVSYIQSPDGGCSTLEYIPEALALDADGTAGYGNEDANNWQASWVDNGTPGAANSSAFGCNNPEACNFNASALLGDETQCTYDCEGCTYPDADNFTAGATQDDGSCLFTSVNPCPTDLNGDGSTTTADLLVFLVAFGAPCV